MMASRNGLARNNVLMHKNGGNSQIPNRYETNSHVSIVRN